jgi:hypothetical protein
MIALAPTSSHADNVGAVFGAGTGLVVAGSVGLVVGGHSRLVLGKSLLGAAG